MFGCLQCADLSEIVFSVLICAGTVYSLLFNAEIIYGLLISAEIVYSLFACGGTL